jgi:cyclohexyl-isocyanide hydratase
MPGAVIHLAAATPDPVATDAGFSLLPTVTFAECPQAAMLCVPGGAGTIDAMADEMMLAFLRRQAQGAQLVTSVCTGSLLLAAAGLLRGYRAACYWAWREYLRPFGAEPVADRVVIDRDRITGGGVTAGIDFAYRVIEHLHGRDEAEIMRLMLEYDPEPVGRGGTPETARPEILAITKERMLARGGAQRLQAMQQLVARVNR